jgi:hypothetical protein
MADHTSVEANVTLGVDTHKDSHVAVALGTDSEDTSGP